jgi:hypothetical protein
MNRHIDNFRTLIVLSLATLALAVYVSYRAEPPPAELQALYGWAGYGAVMPGLVDERLWYVWLALTCMGLLGSFFFIAPARYFLVIPMFLAPLRAGLGGIWVSWPLEDAFWSFNYIFQTFVIGMAFFHDPIVVRFGRVAAREQASR